MQDRLIKILTVKIEAINKNIDNLNYLNGELLKNKNDLDYINDKISIFKTKDILNFDKIEKEDFEKILLMVDPSIKEIFSDKTCNYQGIMYIIKGIRDGISLDLTANQEEAILKFIESLNVKSEELNETIQNLEESKERLPEVNLNVLEESLENYQRMTDKNLTREERETASKAFTLDFKKVHRDTYRIENTNELLRTSDVRVVKTTSK